MKPYDLEQAKVEIREQAKRQAGQVVTHVEHMAKEAIKKLELQAETFKSIPSDVSALYKDASAVVIHEFNSPWENTGTYSIDLYANSGPGMQNIHSARDVKGKVRMIAFFIPVEEGR
jgi:hypothetical protein